MAHRTPLRLWLCLAAPLAAACTGAHGEDPFLGEQDGTRKVLEGVPEIGYHIRVCPFPGAIESLFRYLGEPVDYAYAEGVTGAAFRQIWSKDDGGNVDLMYLAPEPYVRLFRALGYDFRRVPKEDRDACIAAIRESIDRGVPVLSFGPVGPPEAGLVTGYADSGETLLGWSYFQDRATPGYYVLPRWFDTGRPNSAFEGLLVLGAKHELRPSDRETLTESLEWALELALVADRLPGYRCGLDAFDAWAESLEVDGDYPAGDEATLGARLMIHTDQCAMLFGRNSAAAYLRMMRERVPEVGTELAAAAGRYEAAAGFGRELYGDWIGPTRPEGIANGETRRRMAGVIRQAKEAEEEALAYVRQAVRQLAPTWQAPGEGEAAETRE